MSQKRADQMSSLRVAFEQFDDSGWTGGMVYMQNLLRALSTLDASDRPYTILARRQGDSLYDAPVDQDLQVPEKTPGLAQRIYIRTAKKMGVSVVPRPQIAPLLAAAEADALFTHKIYPPSIGLPLIGWIPDFQYLHLPEMADADYIKQCADYHIDLIAQSKVLLVSSNDVLKDLKGFSPAAGAKAHVVSFVAQIPPNIYETQPGEICQKYALPERFFFLPNQFWRHKNHAVVIQALRILAKRSTDITVVCTGSTYDWRNPKFFSSLLTDVALAGVHHQFRMLGLVPRPDVYALQRQAMAILQPSLFEGWSTSIEEAKSLGKRVVVSNLDVHREQNPVGDFFDPHDPESLASCLEMVAKNACPGPDLQLEEKARAEFPVRVKRFAAQFLAVVKEAAKS
jgi:glycosyltransferase involved in cell wall biosynthesis